MSGPASRPIPRESAAAAPPCTPAGHGLRVVGALVRRAVGELLRSPGAGLPSVIAPAVFVIGISGVFGASVSLPGFGTGDFRTFVLPVGLLQAAGFTGAATGVNLARDIEDGWFDRLMLAPVRRGTLLGGLVLSAGVRALLPVTALVIILLAVGTPWPGVAALAVAVGLALGFAVAAACWACFLAVRLRTQAAAPVMQTATLATVLLGTAYAPRDLLSGWLHDVAAVNPTAYVLDAMRPGLLGQGVDGPALLVGIACLVGLCLVLGGAAARALARDGR